MDTLAVDIYQDIKVAIAALAESLGVAAEHVYEVLVKQQTVEAIIYLIILLIGVACFIILFKTIPKMEFKDMDPATPKDTTYLILCIGVGIIGIFTICAGLMNIGTIITGFINPEYSAIKEIMEML